MNWPTITCSAITIALLAAPGCDRQGADGPPTVNLGESACHECGMIISDARFATATVVEAPRGAEALLFDDFNCQAIHERDHAELQILRRWCRDFNASEWIRAEDAVFLGSTELLTPMASGAAAFSSETSASEAIEQIGGEIMDRRTLFGVLLGEQN